jgi:hypothetical protein
VAASAGTQKTDEPASNSPSTSFRIEQFLALEPFVGPGL